MRMRVPRAFLSVILVALLAVMAAELSAIPCPVSKGTGILSAPKGLEVKGLEFELIGYEVFDVACEGVWERVTYVVSILAENTTTDVSSGYLWVAFYLAASEEEDAEKIFWFITPILVEIAPETTKTIEETVEYDWRVLHYYKVPRLVVQTGEELECPYCSGTGRVSLIQWIKVVTR